MQMEPTLLLKQKKDFLNLVLGAKKDILDSSKAIDSILNTPLYESLAALIPVNNRIIYGCCYDKINYV